MPSGVVEEFDEHVGLGVVAADDDGRRYPFHCTRIADGSRVIEVGASVAFDVVAGHRGEWEAVDVKPLSSR